MRDDSFRHAEPDREIFEVERRCHHDGVGPSVVDERDRNLFCKVGGHQIGFAMIEPPQVDSVGRLSVSVGQPGELRLSHRPARPVRCDSERIANRSGP
jgi:hypothetical protein